jgi:hypothetical protein
LHHEHIEQKHVRPQGLHQVNDAGAVYGAFPVAVPSVVDEHKTGLALHGGGERPAVRFLVADYCHSDGAYMLQCVCHKYTCAKSSRNLLPTSFLDSFT